MLDHDQDIEPIPRECGCDRLRGPRDPEGLRRRVGPCSDRGIAAAQEDTAFYEITPQFSGIEAGAIWEDFRIGMEHLLRWERVAVVTDLEWIATSEA